MSQECQQWNLFDKEVAAYITINGTYTNTNRNMHSEKHGEQDSYYGFVADRVFHIEVDCYRADNSPDGYVAWWDDDHGHKTLGKTPTEVYLDLP